MSNLPSSGGGPGVAKTDRRIDQGNREKSEWVGDCMFWYQKELCNMKPVYQQSHKGQQ